MLFSKMHGLGNDFIMIDGRARHPDLQAIAPKLCHRHAGIGADGIIAILDSDKADLRMRIINSDGSEAEMCGNGIRCFAKYAYENGIVKSDSISIETLAGIKKAELSIEGEKVVSVAIDMGMPLLSREDIPVKGSGDAMELKLSAGGNIWDAAALNVGVPHTVVFVDDVLAVDICGVGKEIEHMEIFPKRTNVNFVQVIDKGKIKVATWERGAGRTLACGTGVSASVVACAKRGYTGRSVDAELELGIMHIDWTEGGSVIMSGPAELSFKGEVYI
ncbi:MAG: diaminopimelate epimerase [Christensenellales bacterium]|jgi:diaminopimelate epimerase